ncbi:hypothetical protein PENTCL1PPCAC_18836 [Pristionchus entomophagus]|uniref:FYVE-type domain-containing protein n=1 Tax=Pristionchus entomophagus TaxID=358040 RepID=A0AAV5TQN7_9BILA|nr:hypothetical protein PENTCL1PPCAC_18836 [Pristionchus entomophagus]
MQFSPSMLDDDLSSSSVRQGFLCPFCFDDLGDVNALQAHVEVKHPEGGAIEDSIDQIKKGILSHARKIKWTASTLLDSIPSTSGVPDGRPSTSSSSAAVPSSGANEKRSPPQAERRVQLAPKPVGRMGVRRSLMEAFRDDRDAHVHDSAVRTNMLIIRLDRLINECPADPSSRKAFERTIVPWTADSSVSICAACAAKFSLTRRRHHCRLCGVVMCSNCSRFLSYLSARKLTNPALAAQMLAALSSANREESAPLASLEPAPILAGQTGAKAAAEAMVGLAKKSSGQLMNLLKSAKETIDRTGDENEEGSVRSLQSQDAAEHLRVCPSCIGYLSRREAQMSGCIAPAFFSLYDQLRILLTEVTNLFPSYARTAESLRVCETAFTLPSVERIINGETLYTLKDAENLRKKLKMKQEDINLLSKNIADDFDENSVGREDAMLRKRIRVAALMELQPVVTLPPLPSEEEYGKLKERRKAEVSRQIAESRSRMEEAQRDARSKPLSSSPSMPSMVGIKREEKRGGGDKEGLSRSSSMLDGWTPEQQVVKNPFMEEEERDHPFIEQRMNLMSFLQQAAEAGQVDTLRSLEENLRMIDEELMRLGIDIPTD